MNEISLNKRVTSIKIEGNKIIINLEQEQYIPKKGEYFYLKAKSGREYIAIKKEGKSVATKYCSYVIGRNYLYTENPLICDDNEIEEIRSATEDEKLLLDNALSKEGKKWNPETMQIETIFKLEGFFIFHCNESDVHKYWYTYKEFINAINCK